MALLVNRRSHGKIDPKFEWLIIAKQEIHIKDLLDDTTATQNVYPTLKEPAGTEKAQMRADREARNAEAIRVRRVE